MISKEHLIIKQVLNIEFSDLDGYPIAFKEWMPYAEDELVYAGTFRTPDPYSDLTPADILKLDAVVNKCAIIQPVLDFVVNGYSYKIIADKGYTKVILEFDRTYVFLGTNLDEIITNNNDNYFIP